MIAAALLLLIKPLILFFCDEAFYDAYLVTPFIVLSVVFTCFSTFMGSVYIASKQSVRSLVTASVGAVLNIVFNLMFIGMWGVDGAAFAGFLGFLAIFVVRAIDTHHIVYMDLKLPKMILNTGILMTMGVIIFMVKDSTIYYASLAGLFIVVLALNFRSGVNAVKMILKKETAE